MVSKKNRKRTKSGQFSRAGEKPAERNAPGPHILERRALFSFVEAPKGGNIDPDIRDAVGQLQVLGLLDGYPADPVAMRDAARDYSDLYWRRYPETAPKMGKFERSDKSSNSFDGETADDRRFDRMDAVLKADQRMWVFSAVCDRQWGDDFEPWVAGLIAEALLKRGKVVKFCQFPSAEDYARLRSLCQGLCTLVYGATPQRIAA